MNPALHALVVTALLLTSSLVGWPLVTWILSRTQVLSSRQQTEPEERTAGTDEKTSGDPSADADAGPGENTHGLRGGLWIGLLERIAVTGAVLMGEYTIVAAVVAVKGLGRFKELSTPERSERFVVGTLASLIWAGVVGVAGRALLAALSGVPA